MYALDLSIGNLLRQGVIDLLETRLVDDKPEIVCIRCNGTVVSKPEPARITNDHLKNLGLKKVRFDKDLSIFQELHNDLFDDGLYYLKTKTGVEVLLRYEHKNLRGIPVRMIRPLDVDISFVHMLQNLVFFATQERLVYAVST